MSSNVTHLSERDLRSDICQLAITCEAKAYEYGYALSAVVGTYLQIAARRAPSGQGIWTFLNQPFVVAVTVGNPAIGGVVSAVTGNALSAAACSTSNTESGAIIDAIKEGDARKAAADEAIAFQLERLNNNMEGFMKMFAEPNNRRDPVSCDAPNPDPSKRTKARWAEIDF